MLFGKGKERVELLEERVAVLERELIKLSSADGGAGEAAPSKGGAKRGRKKKIVRRQLSPEKAAAQFGVYEEEILALAASDRVSFVAKFVDGRLVPFFSGTEIAQALGRKTAHHDPQGQNGAEA